MAVESACAKIILFGEHAVVYGQPALAVPLAQLRARARVESRAGAGIVIHAPDVGQVIDLERAAGDEPLAAIVRLTLEALGEQRSLEVTVESDIPPASGLGSGAAVATAIVRALATHLRKRLTAEQVSALVFETEKLHHGTPSGVDNSVIAWEQPLRFVRRDGALELTPLRIARSFWLVIAHTGIPGLTRETVRDVRRAWERDRMAQEAIFARIGSIVDEAQYALESGENARLGGLMTRNQVELEELGVSSPEIRTLLATGLQAGAAGGKLSGGGRGGNVIFFAEPEQVEPVRDALERAGAAQVLATRVALS